MNGPKVLFLLKQNAEYGYGTKSSGLKNSAQFVVDMLLMNGIDARLSLVVDNNSIDHEVAEFRPDIVIIEALWVVPEKFEILQKLHPNVQWVVRIHSEIPFLAMEGIAIEWIKKYVQFANVSVAANSLRAAQDLEDALGIYVHYLPNWYPLKFWPFDPFFSPSSFVRIGCFGAIRPLKNQLLQAMAALSYCDKNDLQLIFHINAGRVEQGEAVLKSLRAFFKGTDHILVEHDWLSRGQYLDTLQHMHLVMSVSLTETFSLVTADAVSQGIPIVTSPEVGWAYNQANPTDMADIEAKIGRALKYSRWNVWRNQRNLKRYSLESERIWLDYLGV